MKFTSDHAIYFAVAVVFAILISVGIGWATYKPQPLQVPLDTYKPFAPPAPAVPTIPPTQPPAVATPDKFAPAPPPVIVTTAPLPTITPVETDVVETPVPSTCVMDGKVVSAQWCKTQSELGDMMPSMIWLMMGLIPVAIAIFLLSSYLSGDNRYRG